MEIKCDEGLEEIQGSCPEVHMRGFQSNEEEQTIYVTGSFLIRQLIETWEPDLFDLVRNNIEDLFTDFQSNTKPILKTKPIQTNDRQQNLKAEVK